jgi:hypothetical protein
VATALRAIEAITLAFVFRVKGIEQRARDRVEPGVDVRLKVLGQ